MSRLITKRWRCSTCDLRATVTADREETADQLLALVQLGHAQAGCAVPEVPDGR